jgi:hypothetical protein
MGVDRPTLSDHLSHHLKYTPSTFLSHKIKMMNQN